MNVDQLNTRFIALRSTMTQQDFAHYVRLVLSIRPCQFTLGLARLRNVNATSKTRIDAIIKSFG